MGGSPTMPEIKMPPPPPPPAPMDQPQVVEAELEAGTPQESKSSEKPKGGRYRKKHRGAGKSGGHKKYKGGGLSRV